MSLLEVTELSVRFGTSAVVDGISFAISRGERFGIIGESGSGKSVTALAIAGLLPEGAIREGEIRFDGQPLPQSEREMARLRGKRIGMVFQEPMTALNPLMRVGDQIGEALRLVQADSGDYVVKLLKEVGLNAAHENRYPHELSGGQRQRVVIAMALAGEPDLLIADEPTSALDLITQKRILSVIAEACERRNMALLFISHDLKAVAALCSRVAVMQKGKLVESGNILAAPQHEYTKKLVAASTFSQIPTPPPAAGDVLLSVQNVSRRYRPGGLFSWRQKPSPALNRINLTIHSGECLALVGPSGCGKSTLARIIVGLDRATSGQLQFEKVAFSGANLKPDLRRAMSLVFQDPFASFDPRLTVGASLSEPLRLVPNLSRPEKQARLVDIIQAVNLDAGMLERYPHEFSGGQRQRLAIARALITRPKLLVLDEPVSALDMTVRGDVLALLGRLQRELGLTYLLISHDLDMVRFMAHRVMVMEAGEIVEEGSPRAIFSRPQHRLTQELVAARLPELGQGADIFQSAPSGG